MSHFLSSLLNDQSHYFHDSLGLLVDERDLPHTHLGGFNYWLDSVHMFHGGADLSLNHSLLRTTRGQRDELRLTGVLSSAITSSKGQARGVLVNSSSPCSRSNDDSSE